MPRTSKQVLAEQQKQADDERARKAAPTQLPTVGKTALPVASDPHDLRQRLLDDIAPSGIVGRLVKFDGKAGRFLFVDNDETVDATEDFTVLGDETLVTYVKFRPEGPPLREGGLLYAADFALPERAALGDLDPRNWEIGLSGKPEDPWKLEMALVLKRPSTQELLTFSTMSKTGRRAVGGLLKHFDRLRRTDPGAFPVVRLKPGHYNDDRYGPVPIPTFPVVGVSPGHTVAIPDTSLKGDLNDEIPM
jgi:hypothetical protein